MPVKLQVHKSPMRFSMMLLMQMRPVQFGKSQQTLLNRTDVMESELGGVEKVIDSTEIGSEGCQNMTENEEGQEVEVEEEPIE